MAKQLIKYWVFFFSMINDMLQVFNQDFNEKLFSGSSWFGQGSVLGWTLSWIALHCCVGGHQVAQPNPRLDCECRGKFHRYHFLQSMTLICVNIIQHQTLFLMIPTFLWKNLKISYFLFSFLQLKLFYIVQSDVWWPKNWLCL